MSLPILPGRVFPRRYKKNPPQFVNAAYPQQAAYGAQPYGAYPQQPPPYGAAYPQQPYYAAGPPPGYPGGQAAPGYGAQSTPAMPPPYTSAPYPGYTGPPPPAVSRRACARREPCRGRRLCLALAPQLLSMIDYHPLLAALLL